MTQHSLLKCALPIGMAALLTGCIDDNYDLNNIDTTSKVEVKNLVLPINLDPVKLNYVIDIEDSEDIIKEDYTGEIAELQGKQIYVFRNTGTFTSDPIHIGSFHVNPPTNLQPTEVEINREGASPESVLRGVPGLPDMERLRYNVSYTNKDFTYHVNQVDKKVSSVNTLETPEVTFSTTLTLPANVVSTLDAIDVENLNMRFPVNLYLADGKPAEVLIDGQPGYATYNPIDGSVKMSKYRISGKEWRLTLRAQIIKFDEKDGIIADQAFNYNGKIEVLNGVIYLTPKAGIIPPDSFIMSTGYTLSPFDISKFSGMIDYRLEDLSFDDVNLSSLPDFLTQDQTRIKIANPQLYISMFNTCWKYGLGGSTGLALTPIRGEIAADELKMSKLIKIGTDKQEGPYKFAISPEGENLNPIEGYESAEKLPFADFGNILFGDGIPSKIKVDFTDAKIDGEARNFPLQLPGTPEDDWKIDPVSGTYEFRAPLALADDSKIIYSDTKTDWDSEDLKNLHINLLEINTYISSDIPLDVSLEARLIDKDGNRIGKCTATEIPAMADNVPVTITIIPDEGSDDLTDIDGIYYEVTATSEGKYENPSDVPALSPDMTLTLKNLKAKINGYYLYIDKDHNPNE